jgi:MFS family permease
MGAIIFFLVIVAVLIAFTPREERALAVGAMLALGSLIWLAVKANLSSILGNIIAGVVSLGWEYRNELLLAFAATVVLIVPIVMIYVVMCDYIEARALARRTAGPEPPDGMGLTRQSVRLSLICEGRSYLGRWRIRKKDHQGTPGTGVRTGIEAMFSACRFIRSKKSS